MSEEKSPEVVLVQLVSRKSLKTYIAQECSEVIVWDETRRGDRSGRAAAAEEEAEEEEKFID